MNLPTTEFQSIVDTAGKQSKRKVRRLLAALDGMALRPRRGRALDKLCAAGVDYAWSEIERLDRANLLASVSRRARTNMRRQLLWTLKWITGPCFDLERTSFALAMESLGLAPAQDHTAQEKLFLRDRPSHRLFLLFKKFPVLATLWADAIGRWCAHHLELLKRLEADRAAIARSFFAAQPAGRIEDIRAGLSDAHNGGRSVTLIEFENGRVIYKPRSGTSESAWHDLVEWMNSHGLRPRLQAARVLRRSGYCWMEYVAAASCQNRPAVRRFYERLGATMGVAYLLKAVDCHRENLIAAGEHPVLVDVDALWHVSPLTKTQTLAAVLYRTGFLPNSRRRSLQSRSSVLGPATTGNHLPRIDGSAVASGDYTREIVRGFSRAWDCLLGAPSRRTYFLKTLARIKTQPRRWIYLATANYAAVLRASLAPIALQSETAREDMIRRQCSRDSVKSSVVEAEVRALLKLDLPYFVRRTNGFMPADPDLAPPELIGAIRETLQSSQKGP